MNNFTSFIQELDFFFTCVYLKFDSTKPNGENHSLNFPESSDQVHISGLTSGDLPLIPEQLIVSCVSDNVERSA